MVINHHVCLIVELNEQLIGFMRLHHGTFFKITGLIMQGMFFGSRCSELPSASALHWQLRTRLWHQPSPGINFFTKLKPTFKKTINTQLGYILFQVYPLCGATHPAHSTTLITIPQIKKSFVPAVSCAHKLIKTLEWNVSHAHTIAF